MRDRYIIMALVDTTMSDTDERAADQNNGNYNGENADKSTEDSLPNQTIYINNLNERIKQEGPKSGRMSWNEIT